MAYVTETNPLDEIYGFDYHTVDREPITLRELAAAGGQITRLRMFREAGYTDISYIYGELPDGTGVRIWDTPSAEPGSISRMLVSWAKSENVFAKGIGLLDQGRWSILC